MVVDAGGGFGYEKAMKKIEPVVKVFSRSCSRTGRFWRGDVKLSVDDSIVCGRRVPDVYLQFLLYPALYLPFGWDFYGYGGVAELVQKNRELEEMEMLPDGCVCFLNVSDDYLYYFGDLTIEMSIDAPVIGVPFDYDSKDLSKVEATSFRGFLLQNAEAHFREARDFGVDGLERCSRLR